MFRIHSLIFALVFSPTFWACGEPTVVYPQNLSLSFAPAHGSVGIATDVQPLLYFSASIGDGRALSTSLSWTCLGSGSCASPILADCSEATVTFETIYDANNNAARLEAETELQSGTCYQLEISTGLESSDPAVLPLGNTLKSLFQTNAP